MIKSHKAAPAWRIPQNQILCRETSQLSSSMRTSCPSSSISKQDNPPEGQKCDLFAVSLCCYEAPTPPEKLEQQCWAPLTFSTPPAAASTGPTCRGCGQQYFHFNIFIFHPPYINSSHCHQFHSQMCFLLSSRVWAAAPELVCGFLGSTASV